MSHPHQASTEPLEPDSSPAKLIAARASWDDVVFVCKKCMRKQKPRADTDHAPLSKWLKKALKHSGPRRIRVVESACLDLCPKKGVTFALGSELAFARKPLRVLRKQDPVTNVLRWLERAAGRSAALETPDIGDS